MQSDLTSRNRVGEVSLTDVGAGEPSSYEFDVRGESINVRLDPDVGWVNISAEPNASDVYDDHEPLASTIWTFDDVVPPEAVPFVTIVNQTDETLGVVPLTPADDTDVDPGDESTQAGDVPATGAQPGAATRPPGPTPVRHYRLDVDVDGFAADAPFAYAEWPVLQIMSDTTGSAIDVWVDDLGLVRRIELVDGASTLTVMLHDVADVLPGFQDTLISALPPQEDGG